MASDANRVLLISREMAALSRFARYFELSMKDDTPATRTLYERVAADFVNAYMERKAYDNELKAKQQATDT